jgi:Sulfatase
VALQPRASTGSRPEGLRLTQFLVEPGCTPLHAAFMTGRYSIRCGLSLVAAISLPAKEITMAEMQRDAGSRTSHWTSAGGYGRATFPGAPDQVARHPAGEGTAHCGSKNGRAFICRTWGHWDRIATREYVYGPAAGLPDSRVGTFTPALFDEAKKNGWTVISMKNAWKRIFAFEQ